LPAKIQANLSLAAFGTCAPRSLGMSLVQFDVAYDSSQIRVLQCSYRPPTAGTEHRRCSAWPHAYTTLKAVEVAVLPSL
jgi:hypothetical protein